MVTIRYRGYTYTGRIISEMVRYGEVFVEVEINGWLTSKWLHASSIKANAA